MIDRAGNLSTAQGHANPVIDENSQGEEPTPRRTGTDEGKQQALKMPL